MSPAIVVFLICAVVCAVAHVAILLSSVSAHVRADLATHVPQPRAVVELAWALLPMLALALVLTATWARIRDRAPQPPAAMKLARWG